MKRKLVAILAADVCGYSRLVAEDEEGTLARLIDDRRVFDAVVGRWNGRVFNTAGDAVLAEFVSAVDALRAAIAIQDEIRLRSAPEPAARRLRYRMGITIGDVVEQGGDLLGDGVNVASRLEALAEPGGICLSRGVHEQLGGRHPCRMRDIGPQRLKNMPQPVHAYLVAAGDLAPGGPRAGRLPRLPSLTLALRRLGLQRLRLRPIATAVVLFVFFAGAATVLSRRPDGTARAVTATETTEAGAPRTFVFGPEAELPRAAQPADRRPFAPDAVPFVGAAARASIAEQMARQKDGALALTRQGTFGVAADGADAVRTCFNAGGSNCRLYALGGEVVWPEPLPPLPPRPWVDASVPATPFNGRRIAGLTNGERRRIAQDYPEAGGHKALALGPRGAWAYRGDRATVEEAERLSLEACGESTGTPCRIVAVDGEFVVALRAR